jgi:excisionase family DNA binding protein
MDNPFSIIDERLESIEKCLKDLLSLKENLQHQILKKDIDEDTKLTTDHLAEYLGCSKATVLRYKRDGVFPFYQAGRSFYFKKHEIDQALSSTKKKKAAGQF